MKKKILALVLAAVTALSLVACGGGSADEAGGNAGAVGENGKPVSYPEKTVKIGVELYDPTEVETLSMQAYFAELQESGLNVEFIYSEALDSAEAELKFIDDCYNAGCQGILGYYNVAMGETVQRCVDYGMYYWGAALDDPAVAEKFADNPYVLDMVSYGNGDYDAGYALGQYFVDKGAKKVVYASGGADFGVPMFVNRQLGFNDAIKDAGIEVVTVSGFPGDAFFADQAAALSEDIDGVAASFNGLDFWAQPIATAGKSETVDLATVGSITKDYVAGFENGSIKCLVSGNVQRFGIGAALVINAVDGNAEALQVDGKIGSYATKMWYIDSVDSAKTYMDMAEGTGVYRYEDLLTIMVNVNPDANADTLKALVEGGNDLDSIKAMHEANN